MGGLSKISVFSKIFCYYIEVRLLPLIEFVMVAVPPPTLFYFAKVSNVFCPDGVLVSTILIKVNLNKLLL